MASLINGADSTSGFFDYQQMLYDILQYKEAYGEIPEYHVNFETAYLGIAKRRQINFKAFIRKTHRFQKFSKFPLQPLLSFQGGKISVEDLSIKREQTGKIVNEEIAGLPYKVASLINGADSTS